VGRRALEGVAQVLVLHDLFWHEAAGAWILHCRLRLNVHSDDPALDPSDWFVHISDDYPWGKIEFYPAKEGGISKTFPHQQHNNDWKSEVPWRQGNICVRTSTFTLQREAYDLEFFEAHRRLRWNVERAIDWLVAASEENLIQTGDPFELPDFPIAPKYPEVVAFLSRGSCLQLWQDIPDQYGMASFIRFREDPDVFVVERFQSCKGRDLVTESLAYGLEAHHCQKIKGAWIRLPRPPILDPWQAPGTWAELRTACQHMGVDLDRCLNGVTPHLREKKQKDAIRHVLLLGFPIPDRIGDPDHIMHWQALALPKLSSLDSPGFRQNEQGARYRDRTIVLQDTRRLDWQNSQNWTDDQISTRGRLPVELRSMKVALIGAGAVGSVLGELLVRSGVHHLVLLDKDKFEVGNLVRHTLGMASIGENKAMAVARHLNLTSPHAQIEYVDAMFPPTQQNHQSLIDEADLVIDCTGSDEVLHWLEVSRWDRAKRFVSVSLGMKARRLFVLCCSGLAFAHEAFRPKLNEWLARDAEEHTNEPLPREGIGCWHPAFPARLDDIVVMVGAALKSIEWYIGAGDNRRLLIVYEQNWENGTFLGVHQVAFEEANE
jgi:hypothetical protein